MTRDGVGNVETVETVETVVVSPKYQAETFSAFPMFSAVQLETGRSNRNAIIRSIGCHN